MAFALSLEPLEHVAVNAQMHGGLAARHDHWNFSSQSAGARHHSPPTRPM
jgi:hypothetical protein